MIRLVSIFCFLLSAFCAKAQTGLIVDPYRFGGGYVPEAEVQTYHTNIIANSGTISSNDLWAVNSFVVAAKSNGYWTTLKDCSPLAGDQTNAAVVKLKVGNGSTTNLLVYNNGSYAAADLYDKTLGWKCQNNFVLNTRYSISNYPFGVAGLSVWQTALFTNSPSGGGVIFGSHHNWGVPYARVYTGNGSGTEDVSILSLRGGLNQSSSERNKLGIGMYSLVRPSTNEAFGLVNGRIESSDTTAAAPATNSSALSGDFNIAPVIGGDDFFGYQDYLPGAQIGWYGVDYALTTNQMAYYYADVRELMRRLGRIAKPDYNQKMWFVTGQSLANGSTADTIPSAAKNASVFQNIMTGDFDLQGAINGNYMQYVRTRAHETLGLTTGWKAFMDQVSALSRTNGWGATNDALLINYASGGAGFDTLGSNSASVSAYTPAGDVGFTTNRFWCAMKGVKAQVDFQHEYDQRDIIVPLIVFVGGETGCGDSNWGADAINYQASLAAYIKLYTGQSGNLPMLMSQQIACTNISSDSNMLWLHVNYWTNFALAGPKYQFQMYSSDGTHFTNYDQQGELYGKATEYIIRQGWFEPLRPISASRSTATITVTFTNTGNFGMTLDTNGLPYVANYGVNFVDDSGSTPTINSVAVAGASSNQITIVLSGTPTGNKKVTFAYAIAGMLNGATGGNSWTNRPRTNIRTHGNPNGIASGLPIYDWAVRGEIPVNR